MRPFPLTRAAIFAAAILAVLTGIGLGSRAWLKSKVVRAAEARGLVLEVDSARPGWFNASLSGVRVGLEGVPALSVALAHVDVDVDAHGRPTRVVAHGGAVKGEGDPEILAENIRAWRTRHPPAANAEPNASAATSLVINGLEISLPLPGGGAASATGVGIERDGTDTKITSAELRAERGPTQRAVGRGLDVVLSGKTIRKAKLDALAIELGVAANALTGGADADAGAPNANVAPEPAPLVVPVALERGKKKKSAPGSATPTEPLRIELPDVSPIRARAFALGTLLSQSLAEGADVQIAALSLELTHAKERLTLGPGKAGLARTPDHVEVQFATSSDARDGKGSTPLSLALALPTGAAELRATLSGGPLSLSALGVQEGAFGLVDVARSQVSGKSRVTIDGQGAASFDADFAVVGFGLDRPWLAPSAVHGLEVGVRVAGMFESKKRLRVDDAEASLGAMRLRFRGALERLPEAGEDATRLTGSFEIPASACQSLSASVPEGLMPTVHASRLAGTFGGSGRIDVTSTALDDMNLSYRIDDRCKFAEVPAAIDREHFRKPFLHHIVHPDGTDGEMETGPDSAAWTPLESISPYMQVAVLTTEDGAFFKHHGFNHAAIKGSIIANLKAKKFVRGASTISMQLAKNLFLTRRKTISRKLEELVLTDYLEETFSKEELMELYLNVIEFGPDIYGVTAAAEHYFGRKPEELNIAECMFLSSLLPKPVDAHKMYERGTTVSEGWARNIKSLIEIAFRTGKLSEAERNEAQTQSILFFKPSMPRPVPRPPVGSVHFGNVDDEWKVVD